MNTLLYLENSTTMDLAGVEKNATVFRLRIRADFAQLFAML
jgi:hypothetical protein